MIGEDERVEIAFQGQELWGGEDLDRLAQVASYVEVAARRYGVGRGDILCRLADAADGVAHDISAGSK